METLTLILLIAIAIFAIGNILLFYLEKKQKQKEVTRLPFGSAKEEILNSKVEVLNKRLSNLEERTRDREDRELKRKLKNQKTLATVKVHYPLTRKRFKAKKKKK